MKTGNIGIITSEDQTLMEIDFVSCGMIFCHSLEILSKLMNLCQVE